MGSEVESRVGSEVDLTVIELAVRLEKADPPIVKFCGQLSCDE